MNIPIFPADLSLFEHGELSRRAKAVLEHLHRLDRG
jgi:hypothetical protein